MGILIDVLQSRGYLQGEARLEAIAEINQQARMNMGTEELILPPADPAAASNPIKLGSFVQVTPHLSSLAGDHVTLEIAAQWRERAEQDGPGSAPAVRTMELASTVVVPNGQCAALIATDAGEPEAHLRMLLVGPATVIGPQPAAGQSPNAGARTIVESVPASDAQVLVDFIIGKALTEATLDRETLLLIGNILAAEDPQILGEIAAADPKRKVTLGEILKKSVTSRLLSSATMEPLMDLLRSRGYVKTETTTLSVRENTQAVLRKIDEEHWQAAEDPAQPMQYIAVGTTVRMTPHLPRGTSDRIIMEIAVGVNDLMPQVQPGDRLGVRRTEIVSTVTMQNDRYFAILAEHSSGEDPRTKDPESRLIIFRPKMIQPISAPRNGFDAQAQQSEKLPRQVLLDTRVVVMERRGLLNLGMEWAFPAAGGGSAPFKGIQIGCSPDQTATDAFIATLNQLEAANQANIVAHPQLMALDGRQAQLRAVQEEWFMMSTPRPERQKIDSGTVVTMTPRVGDSNEITLEITVEISESIPRGTGSDLPIVTRRVAKNSVTIRDGGTVAIAGLTENRGRQANRRVPILSGIPLIGGAFKNKEPSSREIAVFVTARLMPETSQITQPGQAGITTTFTNADLLKALAQVSSHFGVEIAVDRTVKTQPITIGPFDAPAEATLQQILKGTPYTFQRGAEHNSPTYLVYRPITGKLDGVELVQALQDLAADAGVPIIPDPNAHGKIVPVYRSAGGLAPGERSPSAYGGGLGPGTGRVAGGPLCPGREGDPDLRQSQHAWDRVVGRCTRHSRRTRRDAWPSGWRSTTRPSTAVGSTSPNAS